MTVYYSVEDLFNGVVNFVKEHERLKRECPPLAIIRKPGAMRYLKGLMVPLQILGFDIVNCPRGLLLVETGQGHWDEWYGNEKAGLN